MCECSCGPGGDLGVVAQTGLLGGVVTAKGVGAMIDTLAEVPRDLDDGERIDLLRRLEDLKAGAAGAQAVLTADLDASQRQVQATQEVPVRRLGQGIAAQVGLARRASVAKATTHLGLAKILTQEMPHTLAALRRGSLSEWRATLLVRETACLSAADRGIVDTELAADPARLDGWGDRRLVNEARTLAYRLDPHAATARARKAATERHVTLRPEPDTMARISALLPVVDGVGVHAALLDAVHDAQATGDTRTRGQVMADTLVQRITGAPATNDPATDASGDVTAEGTTDAVDDVAGVDVEDADSSDQTSADQTSAGELVLAANRSSKDQSIVVNLVMTDRALLAGDAEPVHLYGHGTVPAPWARQQVADALDRDTRVLIRRLYTAPDSGALVGLDSRSRHAPAGLRHLIRLRDQRCRVPYCDAPIRHDDHLQPHAAGGATSEENLAGLCEAHNHAKDAPAWTVRPASRNHGESEQHHSFTITTPTRHTHISQAPDPPGAATIRGVPTHSDTAA